MSRFELLIVARTADHDGYCSGNENEPSVNLTLKTVIRDDEYGNLILGDVITDPVTLREMFPEHFREYGLYFQSGYCRNSRLWDDVQHHETVETVACAVLIA